MTVTEREEDREKASNATMEQIKKEEEEEDYDEELDTDRQLNVVGRFNEFLDALRNVFVQSENSMKKIEESEEQTSERTRIAESEEAKTAQLRIGAVPEVDPLDITMEMVSQYHDFVTFIIEMLKDEQNYEEEIEMQRRSEVLERGKHLVESLQQGLTRLPGEMERMKNDENLQMEYTFREIHIRCILAQMRELNSRIDSSGHLGIVSDVKFTVRVLPLSLDELERSKEELSMLIRIITDLKELNTEEDEDDEEVII